jgi:uncharacterized protein (DUF1800 family)
MKSDRQFYFIVAAFLGSVLFASFLTDKQPAYKFAYRDAGLTERQAAAHMLSRFSYGPRVGDIDLVVKVGLEKWFQQQLDGRQPDAHLNKMLGNFDAINLSNREVVTKYPQGNRVFRMALEDGFINKDSVNKSDRREYRAQIEAYMKQKGLKPQQEVFRQFIAQKILRATYTNNQLQELLTDFWFNHFNVSLNKNQCAEFVPAYERDVIRPNVFGKFEDLLLATAKSPAMLMYLDNFSSMGVNEQMTTGFPAKAGLNSQQKAKNVKGLNENYAREVMELHTLGVDGGYTQNDVTQAARVLTGWTIYPMGDRAYGSQMKQLADRMGQANFTKRGFVRDGDFLFAANRHDTKEKVVLGKKFPAGGGYEEGVKLLKMLADHPSTARFISRKIAVRFVSDNPPQTLVDRMAKTFTATNGDIRQVLIAMVSSKEFWSKQALREKTKSPFELAISAVRSLNAEINAPYMLYTWISKMGQKMYYYQAPTGFPDKGQYWINTGALLYRMNFGLALASQKIPGVTINLAELNKNREPESAEAALKIYSSIIIPERDLDETIKRLTPMLNDPNLLSKVETAAAKAAPGESNSMMNEDAVLNEERQVAGKITNKPNQSGKNNSGMQSVNANNSMLAQVVGVIIGSPEFQRK